MTKAEVWPAQARQNEGAFVLVIDGNPDWKSFLQETVKFDDEFWVEQCGGAEVPLLTYLSKEAELNNVSFERCVLNALLNRGYTLEELDVEIAGEERSKWGLCSWYKEHVLYEKPIEGFESAHPKWTSFIRSMFKTQNAGDQEFTLFSMQMIGASLLGQDRILLHKTLLYRRAVFASPKKVAEAA